MKYCYNIIILLVILIIISNYYFKNKIGFQNNNLTNKNNWCPDLIKRFIFFQKTVNDNVNQYDFNILQNQTTPEEVEYLLQNGVWPWPEELKYEYLDKVWSSPIIKIEPQYALNYAMKTYNQNAARELLAWNTKEGHFLLYGGDLGVSDGMPKDVHNTIKCSTDSNGNSILQKKIFTGMNSWNGYMNSTTTDINPEDIPNEMPGFSFVKDICNPCIALNIPGDFSCPFKINVKGNNIISSSWKKLWGI
jgi:hypothetical protein